MESSRSYPFRIIVLCLVGLGFLLSGLLLGKAIVLFKEHKFAQQQLDSIPKKRFQAIKKALKEGREDYEFTVGYKPVLNK